MSKSKAKVVIVGAGFGGLTLAKKLKNSAYEVTLIDKTNHHLFQPLLYQVATSALSPGDIAVPVRQEIRDYGNMHVILGEVTSVDLKARCAYIGEDCIKYDFLVMAPGARHSYFGKSEWEQFAPGLKTLRDALKIRERILTSFEDAERNYHKDNFRKYLTFVIVGGGPTGVELAGAISELGKKTMLNDFPRLSKDDLKIYLIEAGSALLSAFPRSLSDYTRQTLEAKGVTVMLDTRVSKIQHHKVFAGDIEIDSSNIIWAAGNEVAPVMKTLGCESDRAGRIIVEPDLSIPADENVFVIGDAAMSIDKKGKQLPGVAPVAIQQGKYIAEIIKKALPRGERKPFEYNDKGNLATIGRGKAIGERGKTTAKGFIAWFLWSIVHIFYLIGFRNRFRVMFEWFWYYITYKPGARLIIHRKTSKPSNDL